MTDFKAKMHQIRFQRSPDTLAGFGGSLRGRGRGWAGEEEGKGREEEVEGREREGPKLLLNQGPPRALLRHCQPNITLGGSYWIQLPK